MKKLIEPFITAQVASERSEEDMLYYMDYFPAQTVGDLVFNYWD